MAFKKAGAARAPAELCDDDVMASDDDIQSQSDEEMEEPDASLEGEDFGDDDGEEGDDDGEEGDDDGEEDDDGGEEDDDGHDGALAGLRQAARRQQPAGPGPLSAATPSLGGGKLGGLLTDAALMLQAETSDAAILQIEADELLSETRLSYSKQSGVEAVIMRLKEALLSIPEHQVPMSIAKGFIEVLGDGRAAKDSLTIKAPVAVTVVGSYAVHAVARPDVTVDIAVQLPVDMLAPKAHLNHRYHVLRAVYLLAVARHLREVSYSLFGEQRLEALHDDPTRPVLMLKPPKAEGFNLRLLPSIALSTFALPRLAPDRNGVRSHCKTPTSGCKLAAAAAVQDDGDGGGQKGVGLPDPANQQQQLLPTPHYNAGILEDMLLPVHAARLKLVLSAAPRLLDGLLLLKVWARQHGLMAIRSPQSSPAEAAASISASDSAAPKSLGTFGFGDGVGGCLDGCVLAMLVLLLLERNKMAPSMTVFQVFRAVLQLLADAPAWSKGLSMAQLQDQGSGGEGAPRKQRPQPPPMQVFKVHFQIVFVDFTGWLNLAAHMTRGSLAHVQLVARRTLDLLATPADPDEAFAAALLTRSSPAAAFDYHWRVSLPAGTAWPLVKTTAATVSGAGSRIKKQQSSSDAEADDDEARGNEQMEASARDDVLPLCRDRDLWREQETQLEQVIRQALSDRVKVVRVLRRPLDCSSSPEVLARGLVPLAGAAATGRGALRNGEDHDDDDDGDGGVTSATPASAAAFDVLESPTTALSSLWVGAVMADPLAACRLVDVGPAADDGPAAARFRKFWGEKAELRRWQDGKITETAVWEVAPHKRHVIPDLIVEHVVQRHLPPGSVAVGAAGCLDWALCCRALPSGADLAATRAAEAACDKLAKQLRALEGLALKVVGVQPLSAVARGTAPLPPHPHPLAGGSLAAAAEGAAIGGGIGGIARCLDPLEILVTLESSGRWPEDPTAFRKMKAAMGVQLANSLASSYSNHVVASEEAVDVLLDGFAFHLILYSGRDEAMLTRSALALAAATAGGGGSGAAGPSPLGSGTLGPEESPLLLSWHHGLVSLVGGANAAFAPSVRLAGRWVAAHMMSNHLSHHAVELLTMAVFAGAGAPATAPPASRLTGFLRFLQLLSQWPWNLKPLVVDPANELKEADRRGIRARFEALKTAGQAPALYICTPRDRESRHWTQKSPSIAALQRLRILAARSAALVQLLLQPPHHALQVSYTADAAALSASTPSGLPLEWWPGVFATPASDFDAFLVLRKEALPHADMALPPPPPTPHSPSRGRATRSTTRLARSGIVAAATDALATLVLPSGTAVRDLLHGADGRNTASAAMQQLDAPASGPDALSVELEDAEVQRELPPKRARAFLRYFPEKVVAAKGPSRLQAELLIGLDPVARLLSELAGHYGHLATFCVDSLGGRLVGVRWLPDAFLPQPLRLSSAHTALPLVCTGCEAVGEGSEAKDEVGRKKRARAGEGMSVPNVFAVLREVKELGLGLVDDWLMPPLSDKA